MSEVPVALKPEILSAVTTAFTDAGELDPSAFEANLERLEALSDGVFVAGTTGEFRALSPQEHSELVKVALGVFGPQRVVVHVGAASTRQAVELARRAARFGAQRFAAITPYYLAASPHATGDYLSAIKTTCGGEVYGYLFPDVAITDITPDQLGPLLDAGIDGLKLSGRASTRVEAYLARAPQGFKLWSGNDADLPHILAAGGTGTVSGCSSVCPQPWVDFREAYRAGDQTRLAQAQVQIEQVVAALGPSIAHLKHGLDLQGLAGGDCRMSIDSPDAATRAAIAEAVTIAAPAH